MNGNILLDTNIVLYLLSGKYDISTLPEGQYYISFITEMELLCYSMPTDEELIIRDFINSIEIIELNNRIKNKAIEIRKTYRVKLPDAIICATAFDMDLTFITADEQLKKVSEKISLI